MTVSVDGVSGGSLATWVVVVGASEFELEFPACELIAVIVALKLPFL